MGDPKTVILSPGIGEWAEPLDAMVLARDSCKVRSRIEIRTTSSGFMTQERELSAQTTSTAGQKDADHMNSSLGGWSTDLTPHFQFAEIALI